MLRLVAAQAETLWDEALPAIHLARLQRLRQPASRQCATVGTATVNDSSSTPSTCRNPNSDRRAVTVSFTEPRERRAHSLKTKPTTSPAVRDSRIAGDHLALQERGARRRSRRAAKYVSTTSSA